MTSRDEQFHTLYAELRIGNQKVWYASRSEEYHQAHEQALIARNVLLLLAALAGVASVPEWNRALFGVIGAVLAALAGALTAYEAVMGFEQLSKLYADAELGLCEAELDWDGAPGSHLADDLQRVERVFRIENGQWGQLVLERSGRAVERTETPTDPSSPLAGTQPVGSQRMSSPPSASP